MKLGLMLQVGAGALAHGQTARWSDIREMGRAAEAVGFDVLFVPDHLLFRESPTDNVIQVDMPAGKTRGAWEAWTVLAGLAEATERIELGPFVACNSFRNPALLAKMAITLDEVSDGRLVLGIGAGWHEPEYHAFGFPYDHRVGRFEEALQIIAPLLREGQVDFEGQYYQVRDCEIEPRGPRPAGPPILIGAQRPRMMRLAATYADIFDTDFHLDPAPVAELFATAEQACKAVKRDPASLQRGAATTVALDASNTHTGALATASFVQDGMTKEVRIGNVDELIEYAKGFQAIGADLLTLTLVDPPGTSGIEQLAPVIEGLR
jgi:alkanesulfonate monooxygenase SsuD/methylene tetrahydromethanopterin reductase-like flavin-dependent oxidoreductase (luciferase family)